MKVHDIIEAGYGLRPGIAMGTKMAADPANQNKRLNARAANDSREANINQQHAYRSQKRKRVAATGIPARLLQPQTPPGPGEEKK